MRLGEEGLDDSFGRPAFGRIHFRAIDAAQPQLLVHVVVRQLDADLEGVAVDHAKHFHVVGEKIGRLAVRRAADVANRIDVHDFARGPVPLLRRGEAEEFLEADIDAEPVAVGNDTITAGNAAAEREQPHRRFHDCGIGVSGCARSIFLHAVVARGIERAHAGLELANFPVAFQRLIAEPVALLRVRHLAEQPRVRLQPNLAQLRQIVSFDRPRFQKYSERLTRLRQIAKYFYVVHVLERTMNYQEVTEIFVRVNSLGAKLRSSDLALAQITSRWPNLLKQLEAFQEECEQSWFTIDLGQLVRAIVVFATKQCLFHTVGKTPVADLQRGWEEAKEGLRFAINFLRSNAGIEDESLLSSPMFIHVLAAISRVKANKLSQAEQRALLHWLLIANARGHFSRGSTETVLNEDLNIIFRSGEIAALLEPVKRQFGRLHIEPSDLANRGANSPLFSLAYLALEAGGAKDWFSGLGLSLTHQGRLHFIQWHHIIPKSLLKERGYETGEINEIANMAFITGQTNRRISNKEPAVYLADIVRNQGQQALDSQRVPHEPDLLKIENYRAFLSTRRHALAKRMNEFIAENAGIDVPVAPGSPDDGSHIIAILRAASQLPAGTA